MHKPDGYPQSMRHLMNESNLPIYLNNPLTAAPSADKQTIPDVIVVPSPSASSINVSNPDSGVEHDSRHSAFAIESDFPSDADMVDLPDDLEYDSSLHNCSVSNRSMSIDRRPESIDIDSTSVYMGLADACPSILDTVGKEERMRMKPRLVLSEAGPSTKTAKGTCKAVVDIFSQAKHRATKVISGMKRTFDDTD